MTSRGPKFKLRVILQKSFQKRRSRHFFLCDCWYSCVKVMDAFLAKGFYTIGALKTNWVIFPIGIKKQISQFAPYIHKTDPNVNLVTVGKRQYYVYRYEGNLNDLENAVVLISYPKEAFGLPRALRAFLCTDASLSTQVILDCYLVRWSIEVFFRQASKILLWSNIKFALRLVSADFGYSCRPLILFPVSELVSLCRFKTAFFPCKELLLLNAFPSSTIAVCPTSLLSVSLLLSLDFVHSYSFAHL